ncbi:hypothetical protein X801_05131 [Opisthorchis viverrini]|uniref:Rhodanese domain-containing protein n=1 Tax=Opisthorchis viverrini TaxID=6198 RepID=A0A1S8WXB8_OPIVI|nr:hypothetical protein X801_05131 [Opisthorchis viverrini]
MLSRSVNFETADMLAFRNKPGRIIIVYDEDERLAPRGATTLVQRGYCNIFLLSGGLKKSNQGISGWRITDQIY